MRWSSVLVAVLMSALSGNEYNTIISPCDKSLPVWANTTQGECSKKMLQYSKNVALTPLFGGQTSLNYDLKKNTTTDTVLMGAQYSYDQFSAKVQGSYVKPRFDNISSIGKTNLMVQYRQKLWDSLSLNASENITIPVKTASDQSEPMKYTSLLKALYPVNDFYNVFAEGSYSLVKNPSAENIEYRNPYSYTTGLTYAEGPDTAINASYILVQEMDPAQRPEKRIKFAHKHKLNKKIKTSLSVTKSLESDQPDNKASFDFIYVY